VFIDPVAKSSSVIAFVRNFVFALSQASDQTPPEDTTVTITSLNKIKGKNKGL
jgi:hypothetical protein